MEENQLWFLIARHLSGEISTDESKKLQELLKKYPDKHQLFDIIQSYFILPGDREEVAVDSSMDDELRFRRIIEHSEFDTDLPPPETIPVITRDRYRFWRYAAAVGCFAIITGLGFNYFRQPKPKTENIKLKADNVTARGNEFISRSGVKTKLVLPDGSQVWLNAGSKLNYSNTYNETQRDVDLEGEAYFDVVKITGRPFIVHASSLNIRAVGTAFVVKSYPQDETIEATLLRGIIEVTRKDLPDGPKVILKPNEKLIPASNWKPKCIILPVILHPGLQKSSERYLSPLFQEPFRIAIRKKPPGYITGWFSMATASRSLQKKWNGGTM